MDAQQNTQLVKEAYAAFGRGGGSPPLVSAGLAKQNGVTAVSNDWKNRS